MGYMHQNYPPFCDEAEECFSLMDYLSTSDSLLRMEGDTVRALSAILPPQPNQSEAWLMAGSPSTMVLWLIITVLTSRSHFPLFFPSERARSATGSAFSSPEERAEDVQVGDLGRPQAAEREPRSNTRLDGRAIPCDRRYRRGRQVSLMA